MRADLLCDLLHYDVAAAARRSHCSPRADRTLPAPRGARGLARAREGSDTVKPMVLMPVSAPINVLV